MNFTRPILLILAFAVFSVVNTITGQDIGVVAKLTPNSGCELTNSESVTIQVFNFGPSISVPFDVSYEVNGQAPITETISLGTFNSSSSYSHTFSVDANLVAQGTFNMKFYTTLGSDVDNTNDTIFATVISDSTTVGGVLPADFSVCELGNAGSINLSGQFGAVTDWEISTNGGASWSTLGNTLGSQTYNNLTVPSEYRALVQNGFCAQEYSDTVLVSIDVESIGGNVSGPSSICPPPNAVSLTLSGFQGVLMDWEFSDDNGVTWQSSGTNANPYNFSNLGQTNSYRAVVQSGVCSSVYSDTLEVIVVSNLDGGVLSPTDTSVCEGINSGTITLNGHIGTIDYWESSIDQISWVSIPNTTTSYSFSNLTTTTYYRVIVSECTTDTSTVLEVEVNTLTTVGSIGNDTTICQNESLPNLTPDAYNADVFSWEVSIDEGTTWTAESNTITNSFNNISVDQMIRLVVQNGACPVEISDTIDVAVDVLPSISGYVAKDSLCQGINSDTLVPTVVNGSINTWVNSVDGGVSWSDLFVNTDSLEVNNLNVTTIYGVVLTSGVCPVDTFFHQINVSQLSDFGNIIGDTTICNNTVSHTVYLINEVADVFTWYASADSNANFNVENSNIDSVDFTNIDTPIYVYCEVSNGICQSIVSDTIEIDLHTGNFGINGDTIAAQYSTVALSAYGGISYVWDNNPALDQLLVADVNAQIDNDEIFYVTITDVNNCDYRDSIQIILTDESFEISTIITANDDGFNDFWVIKKPRDIPSVQVTVLNLFGQIVYQSLDYQNDWNGEYQDKILPNGTYYFIVEGESIDSIKGNLNIIGNVE